jgi:hypothetical protein
MPLGPANVIQARTGSVVEQTIAEVYLDNPTTEGSTVTVEMHGPVVYPGMPAGWEYDGNEGAGPHLWVFRKSGVAAGEGVQGSTGWTWSYFAPLTWMWRVTEWDSALEPVSPLEARAGGGTVTGSGVTTVSTGTTAQTSRAEVVCLATHVWQLPAASAQSFDWSGHTNGFVERDELRLSETGGEFDASWSWLFADTIGSFECTATVNTTPRVAGDTFRALIVVYAAAQPEVVPAPTVMAVG